MTPCARSIGFVEFYREKGWRLSGGKVMSEIEDLFVGILVSVAGWQWGFIGSSIAGALGVVVIVFFLHDNPQSKGLPAIEEMAHEETSAEEAKESTGALQKLVLKTPAVWILAGASAFIFGAMNSVALALFLFGGNSWAVNITAMVLFGISIGVLICFLDEATGQMVQATQYDFTPVAIFWVVASVISFLITALLLKVLHYSRYALISASNLALSRPPTVIFGSPLTGMYITAGIDRMPNA